jgi:hypothetical protein
MMPKFLTALALATLVSTSIPAAAILLSGPADAEDYKVTTCPPNKSYCMQVSKPILSEQEAARVGATDQGSVVSYKVAEEATKAAVHHNDPGAIALCPPPHRMTAKDGCR